MGKRANGEGSIYRRKQGQWVAVISLGTGKRKYFYCQSQAEAVLALQQAQHARFIGTLHSLTKILPTCSWHCFVEAEELRHLLEQQKATGNSEKRAVLSLPSS